MLGQRDGRVGGVRDGGVKVLECSLCFVVGLFWIWSVYCISVIQRC